MKTIKLEIELTYDDEGMHSGDNDKDAKEWFFDDVLTGELELFDKSELGDEIGKVKVLSTDCGWISVEDELPSLDGLNSFLVICDYGACVECDVAYLNEDNLWYDEKYDEKLPVTHWMPLPKHPEV